MNTRLLLVRHGPSSHVHDGRWMRASVVHRFEDAYDAAGILHDCVPSEDLLRTAVNVDVFCASDLPRAIASAQRLAAGREVITSPLLREIRLEPPRWIPLRLPIAAWDAMSHLQWSYRLRAGTEHEFVHRADAAAEWLEGIAGPSVRILAVTHGGFRRILAAKLLTRGWLASGDMASYANWSCWQFEFERA